MELHLIINKSISLLREISSASQDQMELALMSPVFKYLTSSQLEITVLRSTVFLVFPYLKGVQ